MLEQATLPMDKEKRIDAFLAKAGWGEAKRTLLAGDASSRRYERLYQPDGTTAVLMDASLEQQSSIPSFVSIAEHLSLLGLSAPTILASDEGAGFLLLEDFGDALFARLLEQDTTREIQLYQAAVDVLVKLGQHPSPKGLPKLDAVTMSALLAPLFDWYIPGATGEDASSDLRNAVSACIAESITQHADTEKSVLVYRDYHAENLIWLPERDGVARVGLLDFQDAHQGHSAYDLVSLLDDARRDVSEETRQHSVNHFLQMTGGSEAQLSAAMAVLSAQRNLRILGIFAKLSMQNGKPHYVDLIPRVWEYIARSLAHPALQEFSKVAQIPEPTPQLLQRLKDQCGTHPTP